MSSRLRVVGWNVQPVVMVDDGEDLTPLTVEHRMIPASQWAEFKNGGDAAALDSVREQLGISTDD